MEKKRTKEEKPVLVLRPQYDDILLLLADAAKVARENGVSFTPIWDECIAKDTKPEDLLTVLEKYYTLK